MSVKAELQKIIDLNLKDEHNPLSDEIEKQMPVGRKMVLSRFGSSEDKADAVTAVRELLEPNECLGAVRRIAMSSRTGTRRSRDS